MSLIVTSGGSYNFLVGKVATAWLQSRVEHQVQSRWLAETYRGNKGWRADK